MAKDHGNDLSSKGGYEDKCSQNNVLIIIFLYFRRSGRTAAYACSENEGSAPKSCCGRPPLRLCVLFLGVIGACLVAAGAVLGALRPHPRAPLTLLLLMIGKFNLYLSG